MTKPRVLTIMTFSVTMAATLAAQTIRIAPPVRPPVSDADVLVLHEFDRSTGQLSGTMPARYVTEIRQRMSALLDVAVIDGGFTLAPFYLNRDIARMASRDRAAAGAAPALRAGEATFNALGVLRVRPVLGRDFSVADAAADRRLALLTSASWRRLFGGRADVLGKSVWSGDAGAPSEAYEIVGVLPEAMAMENPEIDPRVDVFLLARTRFETPPSDERWWAPIARLKPGVALETAQAGIDAAVAAARRALNVETPGDPLGARLDTLRRGPIGK